MRRQYLRMYLRGLGRSRGYITLVSVLIIGAVGVAITTSMLLLGVGSSRSSLVVVQSAEASALADACAEEALEQIRENAAFTGSGTLSFEEGECTYSVIEGEGEHRSVSSSGSVGTIVRRDILEVSAINPLIVVQLWKDVVE